MDKNQGPLSWLKNLLNADGRSDKKTSKYRLMFLVLCIGAACMLAGNILFKTNSSVNAVLTSNSKSSNSNDVSALGLNKSSVNHSILDEEKQYEDELKSSIEDMLGVTEVRVLVELDSSDQQILETNKSSQTQTTEESDKSGGHRTIQSTSTNEQAVINSGNNQRPIVVQTKKPIIRGVLVVAKGAENIEVKKSIVDAVTRALDVPSFRVAVEPRK
jgi:stage III sporulation protein AG